MNLKQSAIFQTVLEAALPLAGYFYWHWDTSFILLFYLLDWILFLAINSVKAKKRFAYSGLVTEKKHALRTLLLGSAFLFATCFIVILNMQLLQPTFHFTDRVIAFLMYEDIGIAQGYVLLPLLLLNGISVYKQQFIRPELYKYLTMGQLINESSKQGLLLLACAGLFFGVSLFMQLPEEILLFSTIIGTTGYRIVERLKFARLFHH
jgi:thiosulfate reductase cytochrome b subunit